MKTTNENVGWAIAKNALLLCRSFNKQFRNSILIVFVLLFSASQAQTTYTSGAGTTEDNAPSWTYYNYSYSQAIYLQTEIATAGNITKIRFDWDGSAAQTRNIVIYMGHTTKSTLTSTTDWVAVSGMTQVYSGSLSLTTTAGYHEITLSTPFAYNNSDNLLIAFDDNTGNASGGGFNTKFRGTTTSTNYRTLYRYSDPSNIDPAAPGTGTRTYIRPNIQLVLSTSPTLSASTLASFGNACTSTTAGPNSFNVSGMSLTGNVTVNALTGYTYSTTSGGTYTSSLTLTPSGGSLNQDVYVKFSPTLVQSYNGNISISGGGATAINVAATGSGIGGTASITGQPSNQSVSAGSAANFTVTTTGGVSFQWQEYTGSWNDISNGGAYSGATSATLSITTAIGMNGRKYRCVVSGCSGSTTSDGKRHAYCNSCLLLIHKYRKRIIF
jgi:hypothetical protein